MEPEKCSRILVQQMVKIITLLYENLYEIRHELNRLASMLVVLAGTGMRISEISGLKWKDIDFEEGEIHINHALVYENATGRLAIHMPKTDTGYRRIPMVKEVREALLEEKRNQIFRGHRNCCEVDVLR